MYRGFYNLTSGILTQQRVLNTISNNIANTTTPGYKRDITANSTFRDILISRTGNIDKSSPSSLGGSQSMIRTVTELVTIYTQGPLEMTGRVFDFAIEGPGFYQIQTPSGIQYTRNGSFTLDNDGYLYLQGVGQVMGEDGPILLDTDKFRVDRLGYITLDETGEDLGRILICDFEDYSVIHNYAEGMFIADEDPVFDPPEARLIWQALEGSNVDAVEEMVNMITAQRSLQSAAQLLQMYDQLLNRSVNDIGRVV
ncbi:MAG: flagellar hook-basal body protein [Oscillospiraceae bacterium]|nr:flagellar hook-basal body protein [Oscillospiraceae bacterium]